MWFFIAGLVISFAAYALAPKPQNTAPVPSNEIKAPTAEEGISIPVLFGCRELAGPNVVWYGDLSSRAIKSGGGGKK